MNFIKETIELERESDEFHASSKERFNELNKQSRFYMESESEPSMYVQVIDTYVGQFVYIRSQGCFTIRTHDDITRFFDYVKNVEKNYIEHIAETGLFNACKDGDIDE